MKRKIVLCLSTVILTLVVLANVNSTALINWQIDRQISATMKSQEIVEDGFEVLFCGTGSPQFNPDRAQPCTAILVADRLLVFDAGQGAAQSLSRWEAPISRLDTIFLTHLHSDHVSGVGDVLHNSWLYGRASRVDLIGPPGTEKFMRGVNQSFVADLEERWKTVGEEFGKFDPTLAQIKERPIEGSELVPVYSKDEVTVFAFRVDHPSWSYAYGYKVAYKGKSVVISGDTKYSKILLEHSRNADVLIHEAVNRSMMTQIAQSLESYNAPVDPARIEKIVSVHTPTDELASLAQEASVKKLIVTHLIPPIPAIGFAEDAFTKGMEDRFDGELVVARDGMRVNLIK